MSCQRNKSENAVSPIICPNEDGRIREREESKGINSDSDLRPKGSNQEEPEGSDQDQEIEGNSKIEQEESEESETVIPESNKFPNTPSLEDYTSTK